MIKNVWLEKGELYGI